jgi:hypothetical protein
LPATRPVTTPVPVTVAVLGELLFHVPPVIGSPKGVTAPAAHTFGTPVIAGGKELTVIGNTDAQPVEGSVYDIVVKPARMPFTFPVPEPIVAFAEVVLDHTPPVVASPSETAEPTHTELGPVIAAGEGFTTTGMIRYPEPQPDNTGEYVILTEPADIAVTAPVELTVAMAVFAELHVPPAMLGIRFIVLPVHIGVLPETTPRFGGVSITYPLPDW